MDTVIVETQPHPNSIVIWLHGLGADGYDFEPIVPELKLPSDFAIRFIFPHATRRAITLNQGMVMRAWYNIFGLDRAAQEDLEGIKQTEIALAKLIDKEIESGIDPHKIVLAGFSQGGAMALHVATRYPKTLAGVIGLSTYLPLADTLPSEKNSANQQTPIFLAHGDLDPILPVDYGLSTKKHLENAGYSVEWHLYKNMEHSLCPQEIEDISQFLQKVLTA